MALPRPISGFIVRWRERFHDDWKRRYPNRNICCKCEYDLTGLADPPPATSPPGLRCPECGSLVSLRDSFWTDGWYSMPRLLIASTAGGILFGAWMIGGGFAVRGISNRLGLGLPGVLIATGVAFGLPLICLIVALTRYPRVVTRGTAFGNHGFWRLSIVGIPAWLLMLAAMIVAESLKSQHVP